MLIVSEGSRTEPLYFGELRASLRLPTASIVVVPSALGTAPIQVVDYAAELFTHGDARKRIAPRSFDRVYAVFDRDDHLTFVEALDRAEHWSRKLRNDDRVPVELVAIPSVPCFELWLLLHFEDVWSPIHRDAVMQRLKSVLPSYEKGTDGVFKRTYGRIGQAHARAERLDRNDLRGGVEPFTRVGVLVRYLQSLRGAGSPVLRS